MPLGRGRCLRRQLRLDRFPGFQVDDRRVPPFVVLALVRDPSDVERIAQ